MRGGVAEALACCEGGDSNARIATYESHLKEIDGESREIKQVWIITGVNQWSYVNAIYDSDAYNNALDLDWIQDEAEAPPYQSPIGMMYYSIPSVSPSTPSGQSGAYINEAVSFWGVYSSTNQYIILEDDSKVKYQPSIS